MRQERKVIQSPNQSAPESLLSFQRLRWSITSLTTRVLFFFKHHTGTYFWSLLITSWSLSIRAIGFLTRFETPWLPWVLCTVLPEVGLVGIVSGFSIVLWSRLNIVVLNRHIRHGILAMILVKGLI